MGIATFCYAIFYLIMGAWFSAAINFFVSFIASPLIWYLYTKEFISISKILVNAVGTICIFIGIVSFSHQAGLEHYYFCVMVGAFLMFDFEKPKSLLWCVLFPLMVWLFGHVSEIEIISQVKFVSELNRDLITSFSKTGAYLIIVAIMIVYVSRVKSLRDELFKEAGQAKAKNIQFSNTQEYAKIGSWSYDIITEKITWSDQTYRIYDLEVGSKIVMTEAMSFFSPEDHEKISEYMKEAITNKTPYEYEFQFKTIKDRKKWVKAIGSPMLDEEGQVVSLEGCFQDITDRKEVEVAKEEFLAMISHEMRTPLMSIIGFSEILKDTELNSEQKEALSSITSGGEALISIINDVLETSKLRKKALVLKEEIIDLKFLVEDICKFLKPLASEKGLNFDLSFLAETHLVHCDSTRFRQILINLISNAIKFTDSGHVLVTVSYKFDKFIFHIKDTGCGISPSFLPLIFDAFEQDMSTNKFSRGTGLGMFISKNLVDLMNGKMNIQSEVNQGTSVFLEIPFKLAHQSDLKSHQLGYAYDLSNLSILYADDTKMNQVVIGKYLAGTNCNLTVVSNGQEAVDLVKTGLTFDLVIMDLQMPVMDGYEATSKIIQINPSLPVIAFSAFTNDGAYESAIKAGCVDILPKPIKKAELIEKIQRWSHEYKKSA